MHQPAIALLKNALACHLITVLISTHQYLINYNFDIYLPISYLLRCDFLRSDLINNLSFFLKSYSCEPMTESFYS